MVVEDQVDLKRDDFEGNYRRVLTALLLLSEEDADDEELKDVERHLLTRHVRSLEITTSEGKIEVPVKRGRFRSAALAFYLTSMHGTRHLLLGKEDIEFIVDYFPQKMVQDAQNNPRTRYTVVRALLNDGPVEVNVVSH